MSSLCLQDAGPKLADPNWREPPAVMPAFGLAISGQAQEATPPSTPGQSAPASPGGVPNGLPNGHAPAPSFHFGMPGDKFLSFAGPGGDAFAQGRSLLLLAQCHPVICSTSCRRQDTVPTLDFKLVEYTMVALGTF